MSELYWITRCDPIGTAALVFLIISSIAFSLLVVGYAACLEDKDQSGVNLAKKIIKNSYSSIYNLLIDYGIYSYN